MSSSDSEDDLYGNVAKKLQNIIKNKYQENLQIEIPPKEAKNIEAPPKQRKKNNEDRELQKTEEMDTSISQIQDELFIENLIANNPSSSGTKRKTRASTRNTGKRKKTASNNTSGNNEETSTVEEQQAPAAPTNRRQTVNKTNSRSRRRQVSQNNPTNNNTDCSGEPSRTNNETVSSSGRGSTGSTCNQTVVNNRRGRGRRGGRAGRFSWRRALEEMFLTTLTAPTLVNNTNIPTYSVGNTEEYPDQSDNQALFSKGKDVQDADDIVLLDETDPLENEEMSVKVYWQSSEIVKFSIRKFQKLTQIFDYFTKREKVTIDHLYLTYNDRILKADDTPESIEYSIAKFIDGGIVTQSVTKLLLPNESKQVENGIKIKFQCQNMKKPFEADVGLDDKFSLAMTKFAEHLEMPVDKLRFEFDGDNISGKRTAREMELEGGECIDVKVLS